MTRTELYEELIGLADSLDNGVSSANASEKIIELGQKVRSEGFDYEREQGHTEAYGIAGLIKRVQQLDAEELAMYRRWLGTRFDRPDLREAFLAGHRSGRGVS